MAIELGADVSRELYLGTIESGEPAKDDADGQAIWRAHQSASAIVNEFTVAERGVRTDVNLSDAGKQAALAKLVADLEKRVANSTQVAERIGKRAAESEAGMATSTFTKNDAVAEARAGEIRNFYRSANRDSRAKVVRDALDSGPDGLEVLSALLGAPRSMALLSDQIRAHVLDVLAQRHPQREQVARLKRGSEVALFGLNRAREFMRKRAGIVETPEQRLRRVEQGR